MYRWICDSKIALLISPTTGWRAVSQYQNEFKLPMRPDNIYVETRRENLETMKTNSLWPLSTPHSKFWTDPFGGCSYFPGDPSPFGNEFKEIGTMTYKFSFYPVIRHWSFSFWPCQIFPTPFPHRSVSEALRNKIPPVQGQSRKKVWKIETRNKKHVLLIFREIWDLRGQGSNI